VKRRGVVVPTVAPTVDADLPRVGGGAMPIDTFFAFTGIYDDT
jgi:hypothetical protein